ncbi:LysR family transcriptional regulator [Solibacillus sp. FSL R5-0449]|uniref:LysR family transcriptional regulator n=1 Tax=Solibacillus sp. FSL R5-0449 TaxID=2921639 RepID=UPI0030CE943A
MDHQHLQYYVEIVKHGSISKAAEKLHIAQPQLSQLLRKLEDDLGTVLIERYRKKWDLTEAGKLFYDYAITTLNNFSFMANQINELENGATGTIRIGVATSCVHLFIDYYAAFLEKFPNVKVLLTTSPSENIRKQLEKRAVDIAFMLKPQNVTLYDYKVLREQNCVAVVPKSWNWGNEVNVRQFHGHPFIALGEMKDFYLTHELQHHFSAQKIKPQTIMECKDIAVAIRMVEKGLGATIVPNMHLFSSESEEVDYIPLADFDYAMFPVLLRLKDASFNKITERLWAFIE